MKKTVLYLVLSFFIISNIFSGERKIQHSYNADYSLFPDAACKDEYIKKLGESYDVRYCVQSVFTIEKNLAKGYTCEEILSKLDQMGGVDKECFGVSYVDANKIRRPIFKVVHHDTEKNELYIKDKAAGGLNTDISIKTYEDNGKVYIVNAVVNKKPDNIFVRGIKKDEAEVFVLMKEDDEFISVYALIQCSYSPLEHKFLKSKVEKAVSARVNELQNWFYRMLCENHQ